MRFADAFVLLNLALVTVSITAHEVASEAHMLLIINAVVCIAAWRLHATRSKFRIGETAVTFICIVAFLIAIFRGLSSATFIGMRLLDVRVSAVGQFLALFQWVYIFKEKKPRDYVWSYLVTIVHIGTAGLQMPGMGFAFFFLLYAATGVCTLTAYNMWIELRAAGVDMKASAFRLRKRFLFRATLVTVALMAPVSVLFVVLPRRASAVVIVQQMGGFASDVQPITGFSDTVRLGQIGEIQDNPNRVMQVKTFDADTGQPETYPGLLLRGVALESYVHAERGWVWHTNDKHGGRLRSRNLDSIYEKTFPGYDEQPYRRVRCEILIEPIRARTLFAPFAPESVELPPMRYLHLNGRQHHMEHRGRGRGAFNYEVTSRLYSLAALAPGEGRAGSERRSLASYAVSASDIDQYLVAYLTLPLDISPRIAALARQIAPESECPDDYTKAIRIRDYLSDMDRFTYTVKQEPTPGVEPVEDFLFNLKRGHCEYFASSLVVMLRSVGVPARVVNGFKMSERNPLDGSYIVRQSNAHSWAEAYIRPMGWRTLDASVMRDSVMPQPVFARRWYRHVFDTMETFWIQRVLNYTAEQQATLLSPIKGFLAAVGARMARGLNFFDRLPQIRLPRVLGWFLMALVAVLAVGMAAFAVSALRSGRGLLGIGRRRRSDPALRAFDEMERILARRGYGRRPAQTPWEYREMLAVAAWPQPEAVSSIVTAFCGVRYAGAKLSDDEAQAVRAALETVRRHAATFPPQKNSSHAGPTAAIP